MAEGIPPYISYRTFENFLLQLKARGLPSRIDRSVLSHKSGTVQSQLLLTLQYLGLLTASGRPTERLRSLIGSEDEGRKNLLRRTIESSYDFIFSSDFDLRTATTHQAEELFQQTGASGETVRRCLAFFLNAAKSAGIPFSPYIKPHRGKRAATRPTRGTSPETFANSDDSKLAGGSYAKKEVRLRSGGTLTLELSFDVFSLDKNDREFVFELIDQLSDYQEAPDTG
jgi:hypothetical protein